MENGKILKLYYEEYWIFFLYKISISIICFKFSEKYLPTSKEVKKKISQIFNLMRNSDNHSPCLKLFLFSTKNEGRNFCKHNTENFTI